MVARLCATLLAGTGVLLAARAQDPPPLAELLRRTGAYLVEYERQVSAVVAEERYEQIATIGPQTSPRPETRQRRLRSDVLVITNEAAGWVGFRDVFEVDGRPVRDRDQRLAGLMLKPHADLLSQARRISEESARYNLNVEGREIRRTANMPMTALRFLWPPNQPRSNFKIDRAATIEGVRTVLVQFSEVDLPRIISTTDDAASRGWFWIEPGSGRIVRSELSIETLNLRMRIRVAYKPDPKIALWVPASMDEEYRVGSGDSLMVTGHATYSNFRKFSVDVSVVTKAP